MRTTMQMMGNTALRNILNNSTSISKIQNQMGSGQRVINPSDDPLATNEGIRLQTLVTQAEQYQTNIGVAQSYLGLSDGVLQSVNDIVKSVRGTVVGMATETTTAAMRRNTAPEIMNSLEQLVMLANRSIGGRFIFGGSESTQEPFSIVGANYVCFNGNNDDISVQADHDNFIPINASANDIFGTLITKESSKKYAPLINMDVDTSTRLSDLNSGEGVAAGSIRIRWTSNPINGLEVNLKDADTLEDVADMISTATNGEVLVRMNAAQTGIEFVDTVGAGALRIDEVANNTTAQDLGVLGSSGVGDTITGGNLMPALSKQTLLADIPGYYGNPMSITNGPEDPVNPTVKETVDNNNMLSDMSFPSGLVKGVNTGPEGELYYHVYQSGADRIVEAYRDSNMRPEDMVAAGSITTDTGMVNLNAVNGSGLNGTVDLNYIGGMDDDDIRYTVEFPEYFQGNVSVSPFEETNDPQEQLSGWQIHGLRQGMDTSSDDKLYIEVIDNGAGPNQYEVNCYRDAAHTTLVAQGLTDDPTSTVTLTGNGALGYGHVSGSVDLEYLAATGPGNDVEITATYATVEDLQNAVENSNTYTQLVIDPKNNTLNIESRLSGAYLHVEDNLPIVREANTTRDDFNRWRLSGLKDGVNTDSAGNVYVEYTRAANGANFDYTVNIYKNSARTELVASGTVTATDIPFAGEQTIVLTAQNGSGLSGTVGISDFDVPNGGDNNLILQPQTVGLSGTHHADNIFSTFVDTIDSCLSNNTDRLHDLLGNYDTDNARVLSSRAEIGSRQNRFEMLLSLHTEDITSFTTIFAERIDLDYASAIVDFQTKQNIFEASLRVTSQIVPLSLVDFL